jgi:hypothetical protein
MNTEQAKKIAIEEYLQSYGITPLRGQGNSLWYMSPFRVESEASFKVNRDKNLWHDFGNDEKGNIIKLAMMLHRTDSVAQALKSIEDKIPFIKPLSFSFRQQESFEGLEDIVLKPLANTALIQYLNERMIPTGLAQQCCKEIYYKCNGKPYFAIAFPNEWGGYDTQNKYFKGCIAPKAITIIDNGKSSCCVFEGFIDFLSYLVLKLRHNPDQSIFKEKDYFILNSVSNTSKMLDRLEKYERIYCYLDNDQAGIHSTNEIRKRYGSKISDQSTQYKEYKDVNDFLCGKKLLEKVRLPQNELPENKLITKQEGGQVQEGEQIKIKKLTNRMKL